MAEVTSVRGIFSTPFPTVVARVTHDRTAPQPQDCVLILRRADPIQTLPTNHPFAAILTEALPGPTPRTGCSDDLSHLQTGDIVLIDAAAGRIRTLYRQQSSHNALFVTEQCNSTCLMCSQPPRNDAGMFAICRRMVELLADAPPVRLGITGGEPTLFRTDFPALLRLIRDTLPATSVTVLSNGRTLEDPAQADAIAQSAPRNLRFSIPLHADVADIHDHIAQAKGAFHQTLAGFYNLKSRQVAVECRVVLHALSVPRLPQLAQFIWRKLPFMEQVAFMGLEHMGYVKKNWQSLAIDPVDYAPQLSEASEHLWRRGMDVSIYNLPFCVLPQALWGFARQSISDHKQTYVNECGNCRARAHCAGFFVSGVTRPSRAIKPIR